MTTIKLSTTLRWPMERQISADWQQQGVQVLINQPVERCDAWVVYQGLHRPETTIVPPSRLFFFCYEPPGLHDYTGAFLGQFSHVVTSQRSIQHPGVIFRHQAQPWLAGIERHATENLHVGFRAKFTYEDFAQMQMPAKNNGLSVICSRKVMIPGHQTRLDFVERLQQTLGSALDVYGYGFRPITDKWPALAPYTWHLVLENSAVPDYWTEKVADAYLAWCMPLVWGCPNLGDYFPADSFLALNPDDPDGSLELIRQTISRPLSSGQMAAIREARRLVLEEYNLFSEIRRMVESSPAEAPSRVRIKDERLFLPGGWSRPALRLLTDWWRVRR